MLSAPGSRSCPPRSLILRLVEIIKAKLSEILVVSYIFGQKQRGTKEPLDEDEGGE